MTRTPSPVRRLPASSREPPAHRLGQRGRAGDIEPQLHRRRDLVDVLAARSRGAHEHLFQLGRIDADGGCDAQHARSVRTILPSQFVISGRPSVSTRSGTAAMNDEARKSIADLLAVMAALADTGHRLSVGPGADVQDHRALHHRGSLRGCRRHRDAATWRTSRTNWAISCCRWSITRAWREEQDAFAFDDVAEAITAKMIRRHPHVFGSDGRARRRRGARLLGAHQGGGARERSEREADRAEAERAGRRAGRAAGAHAGGQVAEQSRQGGLRLAVARRRCSTS